MKNRVPTWSGAAARFSAKGLKVVHNLKGGITAEGVYGGSTIVATALICAGLDHWTAGVGLAALGTGGLASTQYYNPITGEIDSRLVDSLLWGDVLEKMVNHDKFPTDFLEFLAEELGKSGQLPEDFNLDWIRDPNKVVDWLKDPDTAKAFIILSIADGADSPVYQYVAGCVAALVIEDLLVLGTDYFRDYLEANHPDLIGFIFEDLINLDLVKDQIANLLEQHLPFISPKVLVYLRQNIKISPLVLDLDGDGVETTNVNDQWVMFDLDGDGVKNRTGWAGADDGFLVFDRNGDGLINNGREMFGNIP